jgi:ABC-type protease/lipase transport system fused ATPase/permease subunit
MMDLFHDTAASSQVCFRLKRQIQSAKSVLLNCLSVGSFLATSDAVAQGVRKISARLWAKRLSGIQDKIHAWTQMSKLLGVQ